MKEALKKLKGQNFNCEIGQIILGDTFRQDQCEFDQLYFLTHQENLICKIYDLEAESSQQRFRHQQEVYFLRKYEELADFIMIQQIQIRKKNYGVFLLKIARNSTLKQIYNTLTYNDWLNLTETILEFVSKLRNQKEVFLNINPSSIVRNSQGQFKIMDAEFLTKQGSYQQLSDNQYNLIDICQKEYLYRSPQLLDQYGKHNIDYTSDLFSFAIVLYELLYHQYPFDTKLSQINSSCRLLEDQTFFSDFIGKILQPYSKRATNQVLRGMLELERKKVPKQPTTKNMSSGSTNQSKSSNIFSGITQIFSKLTTETQSWYLNYAENDENYPQQKYLNLLINKLYKKQTKLQKLQSIIMKYIEQCNFQQKQNQILKTELLILNLLRKGPNTMNYQWNDIFSKIQSMSNKNVLALELCNFCKQKIAVNSKLKTILRGNFYLEQLNKFKLITIQIVQVIYNYLIWVIDSINSKVLFLKKEKPLIQYVKQVYCDQILDLISMLIFTIICIRKDNQLQLRKDNVNSLNQIQRKIDALLKKISNLSNHVSAHAIYSLEGQYFYYKQQVQLRENPYYTSLEHFYKHSRQYKGLCIPQNYALTFNSGDQKQFLSNQNNRGQKSESKQKIYFQQTEQDGDRDNSFKVIDSPSPQKQRQKIKKQKIIQQLKQDRTISTKKQSNKSDNVFNIPLQKVKKVEEKKTVTFDQFFNMNNSQPNVPKPKSKESAQSNINFDFDFDKKINPPVAKRIAKKSQDFSFFQHFGQPKQSIQVNKIQTKPNASINLLDKIIPNTKQKQQKNPKQKIQLGNSNSHKLIHQNILSYDWLKKSTLKPVQPPKCQVDPAILQDILSGLKLKELKEILTINQEIIIDFKKLKLQKVIGSGSAGEVYFGKYENESLAIKKVKTKQNPNALKQFERQLLTYIKIKRNPYLVSLVGLSKSQEDYYLLTEFCNSGSLFDLLHKRANTTPLSWKQRIQLALQIAQGMLALHQMKPPIIHRDLKSLNVFVIQNKDTFVAKVADFGLSRSPQSQMMTMCLGTLHWMAPELLENMQYSIKVDIYSYAVVLWEICSRKTPYNEVSAPMAIVRLVTVEKKRPNLTIIPPDCPPTLIEIIKQCWSHEPHDRPSFSEIIDKLSKIQTFC